MHTTKIYKNMKALINSIKKYTKSAYQHGLSLIEVSIVLIIIGVFLGIVMKGQQYIEQAKIQKVIEQVQSYQSAVISFQERYGYMPGDFPSATNTFGENSHNGDGNGKVDGNDVSLVWEHLSLAGLVSGIDKKTSEGATYPSAFGSGRFSIKYADEGHWLIIGGGANGEGALFTPAQAKFIASKLGGGDGPISPSIKVKNASDAGAEGLTETGYNLSVNKKTCVIYYFLGP